MKYVNFIFLGFVFLAAQNVDSKDKAKIKVTCDGPKGYSYMLNNPVLKTSGLAWTKDSMSKSRPTYIFKRKRPKKGLVKVESADGSERHNKFNELPVIFRNRFPTNVLHDAESSISFLEKEEHAIWVHTLLLNKKILFLTQHRSSPGFGPTARTLISKCKVSNYRK